VLFYGTSASPTPFKGGTLVPSLGLPPLFSSTDAQGELHISWASWPGGLPGWTTVYLQVWAADGGGPQGIAASNALLATTP